jgi:hypothetical protein
MDDYPAISDSDMVELAGDAQFGPDDFRRMSEPDKVRYLKAKGSGPFNPGPLTLGPKMPGAMPSDLSMDGRATFNPMRTIAKMPGTVESYLPLPLALAGMVPALKGLTIPIAAGLGGVGSVIDDIRDKGFGNTDYAGSFIGGAARQGALQGVGNLIAGPAAKLTMTSALPRGTERRAVDAALSTGATNLPKAYAALKGVSGEVSDRIAAFGNRYIPRDVLTHGADDLINATAGQSMKENATRTAMQGELADVLHGGDVPGLIPGTSFTPPLTPTQILAKKQGARVGYDALQSKITNNAAVAGPTKIQALVGNNAQRALEGLDSSVYKPNFMEDSLADINQRSGAIQSLIQSLKGAGNDYSRFAPRAATGAFLGSLAGGATGLSGDEGFSRWGWPGIVGGAALGLFPAATAFGVQRVGQAIPPLVRAATGDLSIRRRQPQDNQQP